MPACPPQTDNKKTKLFIVLNTLFNHNLKQVIKQLHINESEAHVKQQRHCQILKPARLTVH